MKQDNLIDGTFTCRYRPERNGFEVCIHLPHVVLRGDEVLPAAAVQALRDAFAKEEVRALCDAAAVDEIIAEFDRGLRGYQARILAN